MQVDDATTARRMLVQGWIGAITASKTPSDYTDRGVVAMKLPDEWINGARKRLPIPPDFT